MSLSYSQKTFPHHDGWYKGKDPQLAHCICVLSHVLDFSLVSHTFKEMAIPQFLNFSVPQFQVCMTDQMIPSPLQTGAQSGEPEVRSQSSIPLTVRLWSKQVLFSNPWSPRAQELHLTTFLTHSCMMLYSLSYSIISNRVWVLAAADWIYKGSL